MGGGLTLKPPLATPLVFIHATVNLLHVSCHTAVTVLARHFFQVRA